MLRHEGSSRKLRHDLGLAASLAAVAGMVNSAGYLLLGVFTSHVTGNVGRFADDLGAGQRSAAAFALILVSAFFAGAFGASMAIEAAPPERRPRVYVTILLVEMLFLGAFMTLAAGGVASSSRGRDAEAALLCAAMGAQNSLVTRLSGAVVRTTHLTGVVTDLAIEAARWFRYWRVELGTRSSLRLTVTRATTDKPPTAKSALLLAIFGSFLAGSAAGAACAIYLRPFALVPAMAGLAATIAFGMWSARTIRA